MAGINPKRQSYFLTVEPVKYSLTDGTNIPPPPESPPLPPPAPKTQQHADPLSHPGVNGMPGAFPTDGADDGNNDNNNNTAATQHARKTSVSTVGSLDNPLPSHHNIATNKPRHRADSFQTPLSPSSASISTRPGVRRMFSLSSLRQSFSSSRTSLALPRASHDPYAGSRPQSPSAASTLASANGSAVAPGSSSSRTRQKRSSGWFRRRSSFFGGPGGDAGMLDVVDEDPREAKRLKDARPAPLLPEVGTLKGGRLDNGNLGWDDGMFKKPRD